MMGSQEGDGKPGVYVFLVPELAICEGTYHTFKFFLVIASESLQEDILVEIFVLYRSSKYLLCG